VRVSLAFTPIDAPPPAARVTGPLQSPPPATPRSAPVERTPVPVIVRGSAHVTPPWIWTAAPEPTVVPVAAEPSAAALPTVSVPVLTVVPPVYVLGPDSTRSPEPPFVRGALPLTGPVIWTAPLPMTIKGCPPIATPPERRSVPPAAAESDVVAA